jgi:hypothetical protein
MRAALLLSFIDKKSSEKLGVPILSQVSNIMRFLTDEGADHTATTQSGYTALGLALQNDCSESAKLLMTFGSKLDMSSQVVFKMFHKAALYDRFAIVDFLIAHGFDISSQPVTERLQLYTVLVPLCKYQRKEHIKIAEYLISHGVDPFESWDQFEDVMHFAFVAVPERALALLQNEAFAKVDPKLWYVYRLHLIRHTSVHKQLTGPIMTPNSIATRSETNLPSPRLPLNMMTRHGLG